MEKRKFDLFVIVLLTALLSLLIAVDCYTEKGFEHAAQRLVELK
jgi:hypothetical protein